MNQLVVDIGNTRIRAGVFANNELIEFLELAEFSPEKLIEVSKKFAIQNSCISSVSAHDLMPYQNIPGVIILSASTKLPFINNYLSKETLGSDRKALAAAALQLKPACNCLIIDAGTCVTYDFIDQNGGYQGGAISPGLNMRLKAMHHFTGKLPLLQFDKSEEMIGNDTQSCLKSGAFWGLLGEINYFIQEYEQKFDGLEVLLTGGDAEVLAIHLKRPLFVNPHLMMFGLNKILNFNVEEGV